MIQNPNIDTQKPQPLLLDETDAQEQKEALVAQSLEPENEESEINIIINDTEPNIDTQKPQPLLLDETDAQEQKEALTDSEPTEPETTDKNDSEQRKETLLSNSFDASGHNTLHRAAIKGNLNVIKLLLKDPTVDVDEETRSSIHEKEGYGMTALVFASAHGHVDSVKELLDAGANVNIERYTTPLMVASGNGHEIIVKLLLEAGAAPNTKNRDGSSAIHWAVEEGHIKVTKLLIDGKSDPTMQDDNKETPLMLAAKGGYADIVQILATTIAFQNLPDKATMFINLKNKNNETALMIAVNTNDAATVEALVNTIGNSPKKPFVTDVDQLHPNEETSLIIACKKNYTDVALFLIKAGTNVDFADLNGKTPLMIATENNNIDIVENLLDKRDISTVIKYENKDRTGAYVVSGLNPGPTNENSRIFDRSKKTSVLQVDNFGRRAIHYALEKDLIEIVKLLVPLEDKERATQHHYTEQDAYDQAYEARAQEAEKYKQDANAHYKKAYEGKTVKGKVKSGWSKFKGMF